MRGQTVSAEADVRRAIAQDRQPEIIELTPEYAMALLEHNTLNRPLSDRHVQRIAGQIKDGKWQFNGDTIKVAQSGDVLDGQHRLWAIIEAKKTVQTVIVYGIEKEAFSTIDTLRRPRSGGDVLALAGLSHNRAVAAMALKWLILWQRGKLPEWRNPANRIENADIEQGFADNPGIVPAVARCMPLRGIANASTFAFLYFIVTNRNEAVAERMIETLLNPAGVQIDDPFFRLRSFLTADKSRRTMDPLMVMALAIKAANAASEGRAMRALSWRQQGSTPEPFPVLAIAQERPNVG